MSFYVQVDLNFFDSKKVIKGARILKIPPILFGGHMIALWTWAMTNAQSGELRDLDYEDIAYAAKWGGDAEPFCKTLILVKFIDEKTEEKETFLTLHNWNERSGKILDKREKEKVRLQEYREKQRVQNTGSTSTVQVQNADSTGTVQVQNTDSTSTVQVRTENVHAELELELELELEQNKKEEIQLAKILRTEPESLKEKPKSPLALAPAKAGSESLLQKMVKKASDKQSSKASEVFQVYAKQMEKCWNLPLKGNARIYSSLKRFIDEVGYEEALKIADYYPTRRDEYYIKSAHPIGLMITNYQVLKRELQNGFILTKSMIKSISSKEEAQNIEKLENEFGVSVISEDLLPEEAQGELEKTRKRLSTNNGSLISYKGK